MIGRVALIVLMLCLLVGCDASTPEIGPVKVDPNAEPVQPRMGGGAPMSEEAKAKMAEGYQQYAPAHEKERMAKEKAAAEAAAKEGAATEEAKPDASTEASPAETPADPPSSDEAPKN